MTAHSNELAGVSYLAGHKEVRTTSRYVHPPFEAGKRVNDARFRDTVWDTRDFYEKGMSCAHCAGLRRIPQSDSRMSSRRQRTEGSEFYPLGHLRDHHGSHLAMDNVLRNDRKER